MGMAVNKVPGNPYFGQKSEIIEKKLKASNDKTQNSNQVMEEIEEFMKELKKDYPGAQIHIGDLEDTDSIKDYAMKHYGSFQIVVSPEALKKMVTDEKFREKCEKTIQEARKEQIQKLKNFSQQGKILLGFGIVLDEEGEAAQWTANQTVKPPISKPQNWGCDTRNGDNSISRYQVKDGVLTIKRHLSYRPARDLQKIALSSNQQSVKSAMSGIHGQIYQLRASGGDKKVIAQLVSQADQVLLKAKLKIKLLKKEELMEVQQKNQRAKAEYKKAAQTSRMLEEKRQRRQIREYSQVRDYYPTPYEREQERREAYQERAAAVYGSQVYAPSVDISGVTVGTVSAQGAATGISIDISI